MSPSTRCPNRAPAIAPHAVLSRAAALPATTVIAMVRDATNAILKAAPPAMVDSVDARASNAPAPMRAMATAHVPTVMATAIAHAQTVMATRIPEAPAPGPNVQTTVAIVIPSPSEHVRAI